MTSTDIVRYFFNAAKDLAASDPVIYLDPSNEPIIRSIERERQEINIRTWTIFSEALKEYLGEKRFQRICEYYDVDVDSYIENGTPLLARHIEIFGVGASILYTEDLKETSEDKLRRYTPEQLAEKIKGLNVVDYIGNTVKMSSLRGHPTEGNAFFYYNRYLNDKERVQLTSDIAEIETPRRYYERLSKAIASKEIHDKSILGAPTYDGSIDYYKVYRTIADGNGLVGYALKPISETSKLDPLIVFRSTPLYPSAIDVRETWLNDLDSTIGERGYQSAKEALSDLMTNSKFCPEGKKAVVLGFSLGGTHGQFFVADHWPKVKEGYFFCDPSIDEATADAFAEAVNEKEEGEVDLTLHIFRTRGDIVHLGGVKHLGFGVKHPEMIELVEIIPDQNVDISIARLHGTRFFDDPGIDFVEKVYEGEELQKELYNTLRGNFTVWVERIRYFLGSYILAPCLFFLTNTINWITSWFGFKVFRSSQSDPEFE